MRHWLPLNPIQTVAAVGGWLSSVVDAPEGAALANHLDGLDSYVLLMDAKAVGWLAVEKQSEGPMIRGFVIHPEYRKRWVSKAVLGQLELIFFGYGDFIYMEPDNVNIIENALQLGAKQLYDSNMQATGKLVFTKSSFNRRLH
jgi:GNAT superfamily N-acetyltransferase